MHIYEAVAKVQWWIRPELYEKKIFTTIKTCTKETFRWEVEHTTRTESFWGNSQHSYTQRKSSESTSCASHVEEKITHIWIRERTEHGGDRAGRKLVCSRATCLKAHHAKVCRRFFTKFSIVEKDDSSAFNLI